MLPETKIMLMMGLRQTCIRSRRGLRLFIHASILWKIQIFEMTAVSCLFIDLVKVCRTEAKEILGRCGKEAKKSL
jgi:hypothetical protein